MSRVDGRLGKGLDEFEACIGGILFADVVGFSRLRGDEEIIGFFHEFLGRVAVHTDTALRPPLVRNTWGDGLYFVFDEVRETGLFALGLCKVVRDTDWGAVGLPLDLDIRVAVHAGPLYRFIDPVLGRPSWSGKHVARAARMEPVTPPGTVYASREFAAIAAAQGVSEFRCEPVGRVALAKHGKLEPIYVLVPRRSSLAERPRIDEENLP